MSDDSEMIEVAARALNASDDPRRDAEAVISALRAHIQSQTPFGYAFEEMDLEAFGNARDWLEAALTAKGAAVTGVGTGFGQADVDILIDGAPFNVSIKPLPYGKAR